MSDSKTTLEYPNHRHELMGYISMLANPTYQQKNWVNPKYAHSFWDHMMHAYQFIFDDMNFCGGRDETALGTLLYNKEELDAVVRFAQIFDDTITAIGNAKPDSAYIDSPLWQNVIDAAKEAYAVLDKKGGGKLEDVQGK